MWPDGFYYKQCDFYSSRWSKDMERTFVYSLIDLRKGRIFHRGEENVDAICAAVQDVNRKHNTKVVYTWAKSCVDTLQVCYDIFRWVVAHPAVVWNQNFRFLVAEDPIWKALCQPDNFCCTQIYSRSATLLMQHISNMSTSCWEYVYMVCRVIQERKKEKWYINAYEEMYEELCVIFGDNAVEPIEAVHPDAIDLNAPHWKRPLMRDHPKIVMRKQI
ncbi:hypothetical protein Salat_2627200 [Sesamum alatum]|uniref:Myb/SANT-like domain-containing protein n=1 Tax=Sesamum alatum TaxID=300844 RepID=A0AAE1XNN2_9LAMI|nr:hypothetical protein Salat_2627200 [Sesamum alatum]